MRQAVVPSKWRFLKFAPLGFLAWVVLLALQIIRMGVCGDASPAAIQPGICMGVPRDWYYVLFGMLAYSVLRMAWVAWHDFYRGDYAADLQAGRDRYRGWWI